MVCLMFLSVTVLISNISNKFLSDGLQHTTYSDLNTGMERTDVDEGVEECFSSSFCEKETEGM